ncbi:Succinate dehydrogenase assembly factor 3, mitochondrial [Eumeta japonica]|uniref:Succinate dehydrogenase assembly factor 3 n=1 Tax=Eumeta variegata TaxID=151549 RepID=A0A4C1SGR3_EUMVA|nr:Succinate dehydrogenase assembly factor 3, mitochondrial [Eumeta japonica]
MAGVSHVSRVRQLYKLILRMHRGLPEELRSLGDAYAREEFKRHKGCSPTEANIFLKEWALTKYCSKLALYSRQVCGLCNKSCKAVEISSKMKHSVVGQYIEPELLDLMRDDQILQIYELRKQPQDMVVGDRRMVDRWKWWRDKWNAGKSRTASRSGAHHAQTPRAHPESRYNSEAVHHPGIEPLAVGPYRSCIDLSAALNVVIWKTRVEQLLQLEGVDSAVLVRELQEHLRTCRQITDSGF